MNDVNSNNNCENNKKYKNNNNDEKEFQKNINSECNGVGVESNVVTEKDIKSIKNNKNIKMDSVQGLWSLEEEVESSDTQEENDIIITCRSKTI